MKKFLVTYYFGQNKFRQLESHKNYKSAIFRANERVMKLPYFTVVMEDGGHNIIYGKHVTNVTIDEV